MNFMDVFEIFVILLILLIIGLSFLILNWKSVINQKNKKEYKNLKHTLLLKQQILDDLIVTKKQETEKVSQELAKVAQMSMQEAKKQMLSYVEFLYQDKVKTIKDKIKRDAIEKANLEAKNILSRAVQKVSAEYIGELTSNSIELDDDGIKGRIIGKEGRNIRVIENLTGVDIVIDSTPKLIFVSCFDPVRREIAKISIERLIKDGIIQPAKIEKIVMEVKDEMNEIIYSMGEKAFQELGIIGIRPEIIKYMGRLFYRYSYGQNVLLHSKECAKVAVLLARDLNLDEEIVKRAAFLHDIGKAIIVDGMGSHPDIGARFLKEMGEHAEVVDAARRHHDSPNEVKNLTTIIVQAADAISASRLGARNNQAEGYIERLNNLEKIALIHKGVEQAYAFQSGRELRVFVNYEKISIEKMKELAKDITEEIEESLVYPGKIKVSVIRENRVIEYAE